MVEFVLNNTSSESREVPADVTAALVPPLERHPCRAFHGHANTLQRQASFVLGLGLARAVDKSRIDDGTRSLVVWLEHEQPPQDAHLRGRQPHTLSVVHQPDHPLDEATEVVVEVGDLVRREAKGGVGVLADLGECEASPRLRFSVEVIGLPDLAVLVRVLVVGVVLSHGRRSLRRKSLEHPRVVERLESVRAAADGDEIA